MPEKTKRIGGGQLSNSYLENGCENSLYTCGCVSLNCELCTVQKCVDSRTFLKLKKFCDRNLK